MSCIFPSVSGKLCVDFCFCLFVCVDIQKSGTYKESGNAEFFLETQMPVGKLHNTGTEKNEHL